VRPRVKVLVIAPQLGSDLDYIAAVDPRVEVLDGNRAFAAEMRGRAGPAEEAPSREEQDALLSEAEVLLVGYPVPAGLAARAPSLRWAHHSQAGVSNLVGSDLWDAPILLTSSRGAVAVAAIAEYAIAGVLSFARGIVLAARHRRDQPLRREECELWAVGGSTLGIVGLGGIGSEVARLGRALGMRVVATRRSAPAPCPNTDGVDLLLPASQLHELARQSDFLVVCAQLTDETRQFINEGVFAVLKPGAVLINIARGEEIDEEALLHALEGGQLRGALLDVYDGELAGRPPRQALVEHPSVVLTPHISGGGDLRRHEPVRALFAENLRRYLAGEPLRNLVDRARGY
jgi:phosphoglycerate dehydrogenase-like enzyme